MPPEVSEVAKLESLTSLAEGQSLLQKVKLPTSSLTDLRMDGRTFGIYIKWSEERVDCLNNGRKD